MCNNIYGPLDICASFPLAFHHIFLSSSAAGYLITMTALKASGLEMQDKVLQPMERDAIPDHDRKAGTAVDDSDMQRMGKAQEFKVCLLF